MMYFFLFSTSNEMTPTVKVPIIFQSEVSEGYGSPGLITTEMVPLTVYCCGSDKEGRCPPLPLHSVSKS